jgi:predicted HAD superfamily hydrolase
MQNNEVEAIRIYRLLSPDNREQLITLTNAVYFAENAVKKSLGINAVVDGVSIPQEYSSGNLVQRSKK